MLGIFLIVCLAVFLFIELKAYSLLRDNTESVKIDAEPRTYNVCHRAVILYTVSKGVVLLGYAGCAWPYLFIEGVSRNAYLVGIVMFGLVPVLLVAFVCYLDIRNAQGYIRISTDEIEYKRCKSFTIKVGDIKRISRPCMDNYLIHLKEKGKKPLPVNLYGFYKKKEIGFLMKHLRDYSAKVSGRDRSLAYKLSPWGFEMILCTYYPALCKIIIGTWLLYASYCCIDYDFFRKDYTLRYNALDADINQSENAWPHYVQAAMNYVPLEENLQKIIETNSEPNRLDFTDSQTDDLRKWFKENTSSWASLKEAVSIDYCNAAYEHISLMDSTGRNDFSTPSDTGYDQIKRLYSNANAGRLAKALDLDWFDLFQMQLTSTKHFINGKSLIDQLAGYGLLRRSIKLLAGQDNYELEDLQKARTSLKEQFPVGLPSLSIEGEIFICCSSYDDMVNLKKIPVQTPLNPLFMMCGSSTGTEAYARNHFTAILEQVRKGVAIKSRRFSITDFPIMRNMLFSILDGSIAKVYKISQRTETNLSAAYFMLDLEEYRLINGRYPVEISQLRQAGRTSQLPDDPDSGGKIIYLNDGQRAILYAVGPNAKDDGGFNDDEGSEKKRDDIIYWQRDFKEKK
jgi:hypothetical protein